MAFAVVLLIPATQELCLIQQMVSAPITGVVLVPVVVLQSIALTLRDLPLFVRQTATAPAAI